MGVNFFSVIMPSGSEGNDFYCSVTPGPEEPINVDLAQWVGRLTYNQWVSRSIPVVGTRFGIILRCSQVRDG